jgi:tRNA-dihydrouridine synthase A
MSRLDRRLSVAPMMDWTDRHCRYLHRLISPHALLYTEMLHTNAILFGDAAHHLYFRTEEKPVALQLGGSDPGSLARAAKLGEEAGYAEINLNCGCPSDRVQKGRFGACLMMEPDYVAEGVAAMIAAVKIPVTVKTRLGVDAHDSYQFLCNFIERVHKSGCDTFILHARKAWLKGLSPKENRDIPPLDWDRVHCVKRDYPHLTILTNGGFEKPEDITVQLDHVDGVMIGRKAYHDPYMMAELEEKIFNHQALSRLEVAECFIAYMQEELSLGTPLKHMTRHALGLMYGQSGARAWKQALMEAAKSDGLQPVCDCLERKA